VEQELDEELRFHLERELEANIAKGMPNKEARYAALRSFGGVEQGKEACRDERGVRFIEDLGKDTLFSVRLLRSSPGFTAAAILTLTLGIGANTAVFSVVHGILLRELPYPEPDRIVTLWNTYPKVGSQQQEVSPPDFHDWREQNRSFSHLAAYERYFYVLAGDPTPVRVRAARVSGDFFAVMGVEPTLGRPLLPADDHEGEHQVAVLSHRLWASRFGGDPSIVGQTVTLAGRSFVVVGVMPAAFEFPSDVDLWTPIAYQPPFEASLRQFVWLRTVGRLAPGMTVTQAQSDVAAVARWLEQQYPDTNDGRSVIAIPLHEQTVGEVRWALLVLMGAVCCVLLIACANLVNLLLARANGRKHELALRATVGAGRSRLVRQLVTETTLITLLGGVGGVLLAWWSLILLRGLDPEGIPRLQEVRLDLRVLGFACLVSLGAGLATGIVPAWIATRTDLFTWLQEGGQRATDSIRRRRFRSALVVV
jgi:predicted permease